MVHLQLLAQICSFSFCDLMDACEILKMEGYVSALDEEPDAEESPPSADAAQAHSPKPEIAPLEDTLLHLHNLDLGWMHAFRQGSVAEPDDSPTYQNPFGEIEDEAQAHSPTKAKTKGKPKTKGKAKKKAKPKPTSKAKTKGKAKTKAKAEVAQWKVYKHCQGFARSSLQ